MQAKLGRSLQLQIFWTGAVRCGPRGVFNFALLGGCSLRGKGQVALEAFAVLRQWERLGSLPLPSCCPWEIETGFEAEIWDLRHYPLLQDGFAQGCGRLG